MKGNAGSAGRKKDLFLFHIPGEDLFLNGFCQYVADQIHLILGHHS
jgi:hypothetical protein